MGIRRINNWQRLADRSAFKYAQVPDDDLLSMKAIARIESAIFLYDGPGLFTQVLRKSGLGTINVELWRRGLTPAQQSSSDPLATERQKP